jgi:galactose oxidase
MMPALLLALALLWRAAPAAAQNLDRTKWAVTYSSQQNSDAEIALAEYAVDGKTGTWWLSQYDPFLEVFPQHITFTWANQKAAVTGLVYQPRLVTPDTPWLADGRIGGYEVLVSTDGTTFTKSVAKGTWGDNSDAKTVTWPSEAGVVAVRLRCLSAANPKGQICNAAEVNVVGTYAAGGTPPPPPPPPPPSVPAADPPGGTQPAPSKLLAQTGWKVTASSQQNSAAEVALAASAADGETGTWWLTSYDPNGVQLPQYIQFDLGKAAAVTGLVYQPRLVTAGGASLCTMRCAMCMCEPGHALHCHL